MRTLAAAVLICIALPALGDELAPGGTLRATFLAGNPVQGRVDTATGAASGPAADLVRELARRHNLPFKIAPLAGVRAVLNSVKNGDAEIGFLAYDIHRAEEVDYSQSYSLAHNAYLVLETSPIRSNADVDRTSVRVGVGQGDAGHLYLQRTLKHASLKPNQGGSLDEARRLLSGRVIDAYAANRQRLSETVAQAPGFRILPENFLAVQQAIIVPKGNAARLRIVNAFIDEMRASGMIQLSIDRAKLQGVDVAPPK